MSSNTFETVIANPQVVINNRLDVYPVAASANAQAITLSEVFNGKVISVKMGAGATTLTLPTAKSAYGVIIRGVVVDAPSPATATLTISATTVSEIVSCVSLLTDTTTSVATATGAALALAKVKAGSQFTAYSTGRNWVISAVASRPA